MVTSGRGSWRIGSVASSGRFFSRGARSKFYAKSRKVAMERLVNLYKLCVLCPEGQSYFKNLISKTSASKNKSDKIKACFHSGVPRYRSRMSVPSDDAESEVNTDTLLLANRSVSSAI